MRSASPAATDADPHPAHRALGACHTDAGDANSDARTSDTHGDSGASHLDPSTSHADPCTPYPNTRPSHTHADGRATHVHAGATHPDTPSADGTARACPVDGNTVVINYCGTPFYFTIAGSMYEVPGNGSVPIELPPGEHTVTVSKPGFSDINETIYVEAGRIYSYPITCQVT